MSSPKIELLRSGPGPHLDAARRSLPAALREAGLPPYWDEWRSDDPMRPRYLKAKGEGPLLFVNERLAWDGSAGFADPAGLVQAIMGLVDRPFRPRTREPFARRLRYVLLPAAGLALVPKCPLCWAAYASVATGFGVAPVASHRLVLAVLAVALMTALVTVIARCRRVADPRPLLPAILGTAAVLLGRFFLTSTPIVLLGLATLAGAAVWSAWPKPFANPAAPPPPAPLLRAPRPPWNRRPSHTDR